MNKYLITLFDVTNVAAFANNATFSEGGSHVAVFGNRPESEGPRTFNAPQVAGFVSRITRNGAPLFNVHTQGVTVTPGVSKGF